MAQVNENGTQALTVDFTDKSTIIAKGKVSKLDPTADSFSFPKPAPKGSYNLKIMLGQKKIEIAPIDEKKDISDENCYFRANLECVIVDSPEGLYDNQRVFPMVSTRLGRGKELSTMADLIIRCGYGKNLKSEMNDYEVAELFNKMVDKEPILKHVECDWEAWSKEDKKTVYHSMTDFPEDGKGGHEHVVQYTTSKRNKEQLTANLKVKKWPTGAKLVEEGKVGKVANKAVKPKAKPEPMPVEVETAEDNDDVMDLLS